MFSSQLAILALIGTLVGSATAQTGIGQFEILSPGGPNLWWVAQSQNVISWACHTNPPASTNNAFQLLLNNSNPTVLTSAEAIVASVPNADCSFVVTQQQANLTPGTGYTLVFADPIDQTKVYAVSQPFEVKALGATYPATTATPTETFSTQNGASSTGSSAGSSSATSTSQSKSNGALTSFKVSAAGVLAAVGAAIGML